MSDLWNRYISKQKAKVEANRPNKPNVLLEAPELFTLTANISGTLVAGDGRAVLVVPVDCKPVSASLGLNSTGTQAVAETNDIVLSYSIASAFALSGPDPSGGALKIDPAVAQGGTVFTDILDSTWTEQDMSAGDKLYVNIDVVAATTGPTDLSVTVGFITR